MQHGMVIIGAGECGARAAFALRENGYEGPVTLIGTERHLPYERPPLSKDVMVSDAHPLPRTIAGEDQFNEKRVDFIAQSTVSAIDRSAKRVVLEDGRLVDYERLLLATGAIPRPLPLAANSKHCVTLRSFDDAIAIRARFQPDARIVIIGGGFIGLELAASARKRGAKVTVIEAQIRIMMRGVTAEIAEVIAARHRNEGVTILCNTGIVSIADHARNVAIVLSSGDVIAADLAVIGIGATPATALAEASGLETGNGIVVNEWLQTGDPDIYAAGDCCVFPLAIYGGRRVRLEAWRNAQEQGALAARNMLGALEPHQAVPWFWSDQYELGLQVAGLSDEGTQTIRRDLGDGAFILFHLDDDGRLVAASGIGPGNAVAKDIRLAEMLIARSARPGADQLAASNVKLKSLLAA
ncbi:ferredoxin reductase [Phyllobacterium brassicacearum]|uniref:Ferredoxin reductase n=1 Tax=Phyllobacterium brassicacearum TaxID=314235 RepID=A0A2P7AK42_9HYPH|nr:FAD-dependent oxidoreductase [Phyllobacterium brassicacearum]PSH54570.1 ferredoxin reductase [Phyllobacterium brassicacearum]TDQ30580.1 3-phenylpropionate/trans-cinnamate dioxygenase ferredoxin reductase subunit [Phyllobacterium brassicacearum]